MTLDDNFPHRLAQTRAEKELSQQDLASITGIAAAQISRYESGKNTPRPGIVAKLAKALDVSMEWLSTGNIPLTSAADSITIELPQILRLQLEEEASRSGLELNSEIISRLQQSFDPALYTHEVSEMISKFDNHFKSRENDRAEHARTLLALVRQMGRRFQDFLVIASTSKSLTKDQIKRINLDADDAKMLERILFEAQRSSADVDDEDEDEDDFHRNDDDDFGQEEPGLSIRNKP